MDVLKRFGSGNELYTFVADDQISLRDNFRDVVPRTSRLPGLSGGFDEFGLGAAPGEIGNVQVVFWLFADTTLQMEAKKRAVGALASFGVKRLFKQPNDASGERYCEARLNSVDYTETSRDQPHKRLRVTANFQVSNPAWLSLGTESWSWGDGTTWGSAPWGGSATANHLVGTSNTLTITPGGNAITVPRLTIEVPAGKSASDVRIQRLVEGSVVDEVRYDATLPALSRLEINCRKLDVTLNGAAAYSSAFSFLSAAWLQLAGGISNTVRVLMDNAADEIDLYIRYYEAFK